MAARRWGGNVGRVSELAGRARGPVDERPEHACARGIGEQRADLGNVGGVIHSSASYETSMLACAGQCGKREPRQPVNRTDDAKGAKEQANTQKKCKKAVRFLCVFWRPLRCCVAVPVLT